MIFFFKFCFFVYENFLIESLKEDNEFELNKKPPLFFPINSFGPLSQFEQMIGLFEYAVSIITKPGSSQSEGIITAFAFFI